MKKGLLLGNGINSRIGVDSFSVDNIWRRFIENIRKYKPVFEATFDITIYEDEIVDVLLNSSNRGIETLAGTVFVTKSGANGLQMMISDCRIC